MRFRLEPPSEMYADLLGSKYNMFGERYFQYFGKVNLHPGKMRLPTPTTVAPLLREIAAEVIPDLLNDDWTMKNKYAMTSKYAYAEYNSMSKFAIDEQDVNELAWSQATDMLYVCFAELGPCAITDTDSCIQMCEKQSSPGYPWQLIHTNKTTLFDDVHFWSFYNRFEKMVEMEVDQPTVARVIIKKELKKIEDINAHLPRTILAFPAEMSLLGNKLFGHMNSRMAALGAAGDIPVYIGCTRYYGTWNWLVLRLMRFPYIKDGDCTKFDRSVMRKIFRTIAAFRKAFIKNMHNSIDFFYTMIMYTMIIGILGDVFMKQSGQTSGQTNTLADNCLIHVLLWFYHWVVKVVPNVPGTKATWASFKEHVELIVMGDDVIYSYSEEVKDWMKPSQVWETFKVLGFLFKYSHDNWQPISELEFCSTYFHKVDGFYFPVLKREKMLASMFYKQSDNVRLILRKLYALRIECWFDEVLKPIIEKVISRFVRMYEVELNQPPTGFNGDDTTYADIKLMNLPERIVYARYRNPKY